MSDLKLARLPDRTPVKMTIALLPDLHDRLQAYAGLYASTYSHDVPVADLIPAMLDTFLDGDRAFVRRKR